MATLTFERNQGSVGTPAWVAWAARQVFSHSATDHTTPVPTTDYALGTHSTDGTPGTDQCGGGPNSGHNNNNQWLTSTTFSKNGGASQAINDTNLAEAECTFRIRLQNAVAVDTANQRLFVFNLTTETVPGVEVEVQGFERGVSATAWTTINDDSAHIGGDNAGERLDLSAKTTVTDESWYVAASGRGETAAAKALWGYRCKMEIS